MGTFASWIEEDEEAAENFDIFGDLLLRSRIDSKSEILEGVGGMLVSRVVAVCAVCQVVHVSPEEMLGREGVYWASDVSTDTSEVDICWKWPRTVGLHFGEVDDGIAFDFGCDELELSVETLEDLLCC